MVVDPEENVNLSADDQNSSIRGTESGSDGERTELLKCIKTDGKSEVQANRRSADGTLTMCGAETTQGPGAVNEKEPEMNTERGSPAEAEQGSDIKSGDDSDPRSKSYSRPVR